MKKILKRSLSVLLALTIIFSSAYVGLSELDFSGLFAVKANAASGDYLTFNLSSDGTYYVYDCSIDASGSLVIPSTYNGKPVTSIGNYAFYYCDSLTSVTIPDSVTSIGYGAFEYCLSLSSVTIGDSVTSIGDYAFRGCTSLTSITIPDSVTSVGNYTFESCSSLTSVTIPDSVTSIGNYAFAYCDSLKSVTIGDGVTSIGEEAFGDTAYYNDTTNWENGVLYIGKYLIEAKTSISGDYAIKEGTKIIAESAFYNCDSLTSVTIPDSVTSIGDYAFRNCTSLTSVTIGDSVTSIGSYAFYDCDSLNAVYITDLAKWCNIEFGGEAANPFYYAKNLYVNGELATDIVIPDSVTSIGYYAFYGCSNLASVTIPDSVTSIGYRAFYDCDSLTSVTIPDSVTSIGEYAFAYCDSLKSVTIGDSVTSIGEDAFRNCRSLKSVTIGDSVTSIGSDAFSGCDSLASVTIGDSVTSIGAHAFYNCDSLTSVTIPDSVTSIGEDAFFCCYSLNAVYITDLAKWCNIGFGGNTANPLCYANNLYINGELATDIVIPDGVTSICDYAFYSCGSLKSVTIPDSVTSICDYAFSRCDSLKSVTIPDSVTSVGNRAFYYCDSLISVTIGDGVTNIGDCAFEFCTSLKSVTIPDSVTNIGDCAFLNCINLKYVFYNGTQEQWQNVAIGEDNDYLEEAVLHYNSTYHTSGNWIIDEKATVYSAGSKHKECSVCGEVLETEIIPQLKCAVPKITKAENTSSGVKVTWGKVNGADSYRIYRKESGGSYKKLADTTSTSYTDKTAKSGKRYYYVVKAENEAGFTEKSASKGILFLARPKISAIANKSNGVKIAWGKVSGAKEYKVYRKVSGGSYKYLGKTTGTSYTDKSAKSGTKYYYVVKSVNGSYVSEKSASKSITFLVAPKISSATSNSEGILVKWNKVSGASGYYVYRKASSGEWKKIATVKGNSKIKYLDETPRKGATYQYRVKAYYGSSASVSSNTYKIKCKY